MDVNDLTLVQTHAECIRVAKLLVRAVEQTNDLAYNDAQHLLTRARANYAYKRRAAERTELVKLAEREGTP